MTEQQPAAPEFMKATPLAMRNRTFDPKDYPVSADYDSTASGAQ